jgi:hypothetical protein
MDTLYTRRRAELLRTRYQFAWYDAVRFPVSDFVKVFFAQGGIRRTARAYRTMLQAFYSFVVFAKVWEQKQYAEIDMPLTQIAGELQKKKRDITYWILSTK